MSVLAANELKSPQEAQTIVVSISPQSRASLAAHFNLPISEIMGTLVKHHLAEQLNKQPQDIYHVTIMPCYDKKLEASRSDFYSDVFKTRDVDCVLSSTEILDMLTERSVDFAALPSSDLPDSPFTARNSEDVPTGVEGSTGGYFEYLFRAVARSLFNVEVGEIKYEVGRNSDFKEARLVVDGKDVLVFAKAYGFRNIQNVVRKIKSGKCNYHFVEVMACPSGCINGGGQIKAGTGSLRDQKAHIQQAEDRYNEQVIVDPQENAALSRIYQQWLSGVFSPDAQTNLHTQYHMIAKTKNALSIKW
eukprot:gene9147-10732_t